jgi:hypothetical protein
MWIVVWLVALGGVIQNKDLVQGYGAPALPAFAHSLFTRGLA